MSGSCDFNYSSHLLSILFPSLRETGMDFSDCFDMFCGYFSLTLPQNGSRFFLNSSNALFTPGIVGTEGFEVRSSFASAIFELF